MSIIVLLMLLGPSAQAAPNACYDLFKITLPYQSELQQISEQLTRSREVSRNPINLRDQAYLKTILQIPRKTLLTLSPKELLDIYALFARWNLLPPDKFQRDLVYSLKRSLPDWTPNNFLNFAIHRKITPMEFPANWLKVYTQHVERRFSEFSLETKMEVLSAELYHGTYWTVKSLANVLNQTQAALDNAVVAQKIKPLKELHRGLMFLRSQEPSFFTSITLRLQNSLEKHLMEHHKISLSSDGTSGAINEQHGVSLRQIDFEHRLDAMLGHPAKVREYSDPHTAGFYDPVDVFYPTKNVVLEWDGPHHFARTLSLEGAIDAGIPLTYRPLDQAKNRAWKRGGYIVIRITPELNFQLNTIDIQQLIDLQNH